MTPNIAIIGGGLAGCEAALQLAKAGVAVTLYDMKPNQTSPAHHNPHLAEIVCSNSLGSQGEATASGLLKLELAALDCELLKIAQSVAVPAGQALAVDREKFSQTVTERIHSEPLITFVGEAQETLPDADFILIATGPMTSPGLAQTLAQLVNRSQLFFFDAAAPIVTRDSVNLDLAFVQDRYAFEKREEKYFKDNQINGRMNERGPRRKFGSAPLTEEALTQTQKWLTELTETRDGTSYINCPLNVEEYEALVAFILAAEKTPLKAFEQNTDEAQSQDKTCFFESCLPVEVMASRGMDTLRFGPMKPVGLIDPRTGLSPYAAVQLRQDNAEGTLYNLVGFQTNIRWGAQKAMIQMIPGLENADVVRYGVMHRNTYLHSPEVLLPTLQLKAHPHILIGGQLTGTEGYTESIATGLMAAQNLLRLVREQASVLPPAETMMGALVRYITRPEAIGQGFQPINSNWGILPPLTNTTGLKPKDKKARNQRHVVRALEAISGFAALEKPEPHLASV